MDAIRRIQMEKRRDALIDQLRSIGNLMRGTLIQARVKCGRAGCVCESGEKHEKLHLSLNLHGRTRGCYVGEARREEVATLIAEYQRAWHLIEQLTEVNLELLRGEHAGGRRRKRA
jgi:hypothetical protein